MKNIKLALVLSAVMLSVANMAQADSTNQLNNHFMSKRAYYAPVKTDYQIAASTQWEGATFRPAASHLEDNWTSKGAQNLKQLKIHSFAKRSFM